MSDAIQLDWSSLVNLLPLCQEFAEQMRKKEEIDLRDAAKRLGQAVGVDDLDKFAKDQLKNAIGDGLGQVFDKKASKTVSVLFAKQCKPVMTIVVKYAQGNLEAPGLIAELNKIHFEMVKDLEPALADMLGIPDDFSNMLADQFGPYLVSIYCFAAAYKIYQKAANDAQLAKERRLQIERLTNESIAKLKAERAELNALVSRYMLDRLVPFDEGVAAMDNAILEEDDDGFIRANAELWELFGRNSQYSNAAEFDELMLSDEAFKL